MDELNKEIELKIKLPRFVVNQLKNYYKFMFNTMYYSGIAKHFTFEEFVSAYIRTHATKDLQNISSLNLLDHSHE